MDEIVVVTGHAREKVEEALSGCAARCAFNPDYTDGDMLRSFQVGLSALENSEAALFVLGDQPQMRESSVRTLVERWQTGRARIVAPSFQGRRGHPILFAREAWSDLMNAPRGFSPRDFLRAHPDWIEEVIVNTDSILRDVDTPDDYRREGLIG
jgi:molybdenum cofactor cytidylyltransferase